jgi:hypothetical protein
VPGGSERRGSTRSTGRRCARAASDPVPPRRERSRRKRWFGKGLRRKRQLRKDDAVGGKYARLQTATHTPIAVAEGMDHRQVELCHGGPDHRTAHSGVQLVDQFGHQRLDLLGVRGLIDGVAVLVLDPNGTGPPQDRALGQIASPAGRRRGSRRNFEPHEASRSEGWQVVGRVGPRPDPRAGACRPSGAGQEGCAMCLLAVPSKGHAGPVC